jgi:hypothetical protein
MSLANSPSHFRGLPEFKSHPIDGFIAENNLSLRQQKMMMLLLQ